MGNTLIENISDTGIDFETFKRNFNRQVENPDLQNPGEVKFYEYRKLNLQRTNRLDKTFIPSEDLVNIISKIKKPQIWMVITESWCGDSAQSLPIIAKAAALNRNINLRIVLRDENPDIMDKYLTNGSRSIPKFVVFDEDNNELFQWGPRPVEAQKLYGRLKDEGKEKSEINKELHLWYGRNRGKEIEKELVNLLSKVIEN